MRHLLVLSVVLFVCLGLVPGRSVRSTGEAPTVKMFFNGTDSANCGDCEWESGQVGATDGPEQTIDNGEIEPNCTTSSCGSIALPASLPTGITEVLGMEQTTDDVQLRWEFVETAINDVCLVVWQMHENDTVASDNQYLWLSSGSFAKFNDARALLRGGSEDNLEIRNYNTGSPAEDNTPNSSYVHDTWYKVTYCFDEDNNDWNIWIDGDPSVDSPDATAADLNSGGGDVDGITLGQEFNAFAVYFAGICVWTGKSVSDPPSAADIALCAP